jgi:hypothetical protein
MILAVLEEDAADKETKDEIFTVKRSPRGLSDIFGSNSVNLQVPCFE